MESGEIMDTALIRGSDSRHRSLIIGKFVRGLILKHEVETFLIHHTSHLSFAELPPYELTDD